MKLASSGFKSPTVVERPIVRSRRQRDRVASIERANQSVARVARFRVPSDVPKTGGVVSAEIALVPLADDFTHRARLNLAVVVERDVEFGFKE